MHDNILRLGSLFLYCLSRAGIAVLALVLPQFAALGDSQPSKVSVLDVKVENGGALNQPAVQLRDELHDMIGQMIMVGFHGRTKDALGTKETAALIRDGTIGGVILMDRNISSKQRLVDMTRTFLNARTDQPPFIAIDQEGGAVQRLKRRNGFDYTPSAAKIARTTTLQDALGIYVHLAEQLRDAGINMNFGPVVDLGINRRNPIVTRQGRTYGTDPDEVAKYASVFVDAHRAAGVITVAKHFPGHGSSWTDSHRRLVDLTKTWTPIELKPFELLTRSGGPTAVMVGHLYHPAFGGEEKLPASLSKAAIEGELRTEMNFYGLVITDDLEMSAVQRKFKNEDLTVRAVNAGNDIILFSDATKKGRHTPRLIHKYIRDAVDSGRIPRQRIKESYRRIMKAKETLRASQSTALRRDAESHPTASK